MEYTALTTDDKRAIITQSIARLEQTHYTVTFNAAVTGNEQERVQFLADAATLAEMIARARAELDALTDSP